MLDIAHRSWPVATVEELDERLDWITAEVAAYRVRPVEVDLYLPGGMWMAPGICVSLGGALSYAVFHDHDNVEFLSVGEAGAPDQPEFDVPGHALIPTHQARQALREFYVSRREPDILRWTRSSTPTDTDRQLA
ncbi:Imm1 family immunity protein [Actinokineospora sp.]|uniref:Imm1 family immunity protein n=1 Tax=Actinokineospora sp. TaxID=1872133 RepID=UPI004037E370